MNVLMKFLPELEILISRIAEVKATNDETEQQRKPETMEEKELPPEETMGALKDIA